MKIVLKFVVTLMVMMCAACGQKQENSSMSACIKKDSTSKTVVRVIIYNDFPQSLAESTLSKMQEIFDSVIVIQGTKLPASAYYNVNHRYKAHLVIDQERNTYKNKQEALIGFTSKDISTKVHGYDDYGVMGLTLISKKAAVVSTYRLHKSKAMQADEFYKLTLHELGHAYGLPHCKHSQTCYMCDANTKNHFPSLTDFCPTCKSFLQKKGWGF